MPEFEINDFKGIYSGTVKPPKNGASICRNFDLRNQSGVLEQRYGSGKAFDNKPEGLSVSSISFLDAESFYIPGVGSGQEITIQVGKGTITSERVTIGSQFTQAIPLIWASHYWNGSAWVAKTNTTDHWNWLNETVCTRLQAVDPAVAGHDYKIAVDILEDGRAVAGYFNGWYIENQTDGGVLRIVDSYVWNDGVNNKIAFKLDGNANIWNPANQGRLFIMKNYIPVANLVSMGVADRNDITFLKIRDEIRIAFGAKADRMALAVSYQKNYLNIKEFAVEAYSSALISAYCKTDGLVISPYSLLTDNVRLELTTVGSGTWPANTHYVKASATMAAGDELLVTEETKLTTVSPTALYTNASIQVATLNLRAFSLKFYYSNDSLLKVFYLIFIDKIRSENKEDKFSVDIQGRMKLIDSLLEVHDPGTASAAAPVTVGDPANVGDWELLGPQAALTAVADVGAGSVNVLDIEMVEANYNNMGMFYYPSGGLVGISSDSLYDVVMWLKRDAGTLVKVLHAYFHDMQTGVDGPVTQVEFDGTWTEYTFQIQTPVTSDASKLALYFYFDRNVLGVLPAGETVRFDRLSVKAYTQHTINELTVQQSEMNSEFGYTPTRNLIRSWDTGLVTAGKTFVTNVYIEKLYTNKIFFSAVGGAGNSMYDVLVAGLFYDIENFDGNDVKKIELLSNADFLLLQSLASQRLDPDSGRTASIGLNSGTVQPFGSVNFGDKIIFPSKYDVMATSGIGVADISENTIRGLYRDLTDAEIAKMCASKDVYGGAYVLYSGRNTTKEEYILTKAGWIERRLAQEPQRYFVDRQGTLKFLSNGDIYAIGKTYTSGDTATPIASLWESIIFDAESMGESITAEMKFVLTDFFVTYISNGDLTFNLYLLDNIAPVTHDTQIIPKSTTYGKFTYRRPLKQAGVCSRFKIGLSYSGNGGPSECSIYSVGVVFDVIKGKLHAQ